MYDCAFDKLLAPHAGLFRQQKVIMCIADICAVAEMLKLNTQATKINVYGMKIAL